jgi:hypothetical protein
MVPVRDWVAWHRDYDDPGSPLSKRPERVSWHLAWALDQAPPGPIRLVCLCAEQGRDTGQIRSWFAEGGFEEVAVEAVDGEFLTSVGVHRLATRPEKAAELPQGPLFSFGSNHA